MLSPAAMFIEAAAESLIKKEHAPPEWIQESQLKELHSFGDTRAQELGASGVTKDFEKGYELGLQVARTILFSNPKLILNNIKPEDLL